ncbi:MAG: electron transfer flavoprotein subunit beta/FixA family protein [Candidatus Tectomicrobia bacterium]|uniref:Electron transfer flavoprotein subunit beta/FixA family protein n=1 Tax=Tectimicrobiota bacterium TaxID=2528274 RepID=A0A932CNW3_UNCTE|nr:electron transfer flavoprotein subunit beta/FixA family protein [Candidatus Tectomicrobia bacterium]
MQIIVCIKQVPDTSFQVAIDFKAGRIEPEDGIFRLNPADKVALEAALQLKERFPGSTLRVLTLGPPEAEEVLRRGLAWGADQGIHLCDPSFEGSDAYATAGALAQAISRLGFDLILCGQRSGGSGQVGSMMAERLDIPHVAAVTHLEPGLEEVRVHRRRERGYREVVRCSLPALLSLDEGLNRPRHPSFPQLLQARRQEILRWDTGALELAWDQVGPRGSLVRGLGISPPRPRPKKIFTPESNLPAAERMKLMMSGGLTQKKSGSLIEEDPNKAASQAVQFILKEKIIAPHRP